MKEITVSLRNKTISDFAPIIEQMAAEGCDKDSIVRAYQNHIHAKSKSFYSKHKMTRIFSCLNFKELKKADSKIEMIFYNLLSSSGIKFQFQNNIGPYRVDYLINGFLVIELDGPQHVKRRDDNKDSYLHNMGYKIIRVPVWVLVSHPDTVIKSIKDAIEMKEV